MHTAVNSSAVQSFPYVLWTLATASLNLCCLQGWQHERVVKWDGREGRVLLVIPDDPATHLKKVQAGCKRLLSQFCIDKKSLACMCQISFCCCLLCISSNALAAIDVYIVCFCTGERDLWCSRRPSWALQRLAAVCSLPGQTTHNANQHTCSCVICTARHVQRLPIVHA